jgi:chemotaxis protein CheD
MAEPSTPLEVYLHPGESHLVSQPAILRTVLGSCVGITFCHVELGLAAMCHPMLPTYPASRSHDIGLQAGRRYVDFTIQEMASRFDSLGARRSHIEVKLFGGADVLPVNPNSSMPTVGALNCQAALATLAAEGFEVAAQSLGGASGINIQLDSRTGEVLLRRLAETAAKWRPYPFPVSNRPLVLAPRTAPDSHGT